MVKTFENCLAFFQIELNSTQIESIYPMARNSILAQKYLHKNVHSRPIHNKPQTGNKPNVLQQENKSMIHNYTTEY